MATNLGTGLLSLPLMIAQQAAKQSASQATAQPTAAPKPGTSAYYQSLGSKPSVSTGNAAVDKAYDLYQQSMITGVKTPILESAYKAAGITNAMNAGDLFSQYGLKTGAPTNDYVAYYGPQVMKNGYGNFSYSPAGAAGAAGALQRAGVDPSTVNLGANYYNQAAQNNPYAQAGWNAAFGKQQPQQNPYQQQQNPYQQQQNPYVALNNLIQNNPYIQAQQAYGQTFGQQGYNPYGNQNQQNLGFGGQNPYQNSYQQPQQQQQQYNPYGNQNTGYGGNIRKGVIY